MKDMDLINDINKKWSDINIQDHITSLIPNTSDKIEIAFIEGYKKGAQQIRDKIIEIINGKH